MCSQLLLCSLFSCLTICRLTVIFIVLQVSPFTSLHVMCLNIVASGRLHAKGPQTFYAYPQSDTKEATQSGYISGGFLQPDHLATRHIDSIVKATQRHFFQSAGGRLDAGVCL